jgi:hypothetical protein
MVFLVQWAPLLALVGKTRGRYGLARWCFLHGRRFLVAGCRGTHSFLLLLFFSSLSSALSLFEYSSWFSVGCRRKYDRQKGSTQRPTNTLVIVRMCQKERLLSTQDASQALRQSCYSAQLQETTDHPTAVQQFTPVFSRHFLQSACRLRAVLRQRGHPTPQKWSPQAALALHARQEQPGV